MVKDVLGWLDYSTCAEVALVLFVAVFLVVSIRTIFSKDRQIGAAAMIPLVDQPTDEVDEQ